MEQGSNLKRNYHNLSRCIGNVISQFGLVKVMGLDIGDEDTIEEILSEVDYSIQWGENVEPDDKMYDQVEEQLL